MVTRQKFLELACAYLADHQQSSGKFTYRLRRDGGKVKRDYNTLRHAGTIYALNQADAHVDRDLTPTIEAALDYLFRRGEFEDPETSPRPHVILLDLRMPKLDGILYGVSRRR